MGESHRTASAGTLTAFAMSALLGVSLIACIQDEDVRVELGAIGFDAEHDPVRGQIYVSLTALNEIAVVSTQSGVRSYALDAETAKRLWAISERAVGVTGMRAL